jgi:hypothetical protein
MAPETGLPVSSVTVPEKSALMVCPLKWSPEVTGLGGGSIVCSSFLQAERTSKANRREKTYLMIREFGSMKIGSLDRNGAE